MKGFQIGHVYMAIQGLHEKLTHVQNDKDSKIAALERRVVELERLLSRLAPRSAVPDENQ